MQEVQPLLHLAVRMATAPRSQEPVRILQQPPLEFVLQVAFLR